MLTRWPLIAAAALLAYAGSEWAKQQEMGGMVDDLAATVDDVKTTIVNGLSGYSSARVPERYRAAILQAEQENGLPDGMLARLLWQESRYKQAVIDGRSVSPAGALGIAQFMPATAAQMGIDPLDPYQAIPAAGRYLAGLYRQTGDWSKALAAYNWGIGNVKRKGMNSAPSETRNYYTQILNDIGLGGLVYA